MTKYKSLVFDLDDTLLDTSHLLVPMASRNACEAMIQAGLHCELQECMRLRQSMAAELSHSEIFSQIVDKFGADDKDKALKNALEKFYRPYIPGALPLMPGALENLKNLAKNYRLFLVTMGDLETQNKKIKALDIEKFFARIFILDSFAGEKKEKAFRLILQQENLSPAELLSIGNRLSSEIRDAKRCGSDTCYFAFGEHFGERVQFPEDRPDFTITHHQELINTCGL